MEGKQTVFKSSSSFKALKKTKSHQKTKCVEEMSRARWSCHFVNSQTEFCLPSCLDQTATVTQSSSGFKSRTLERKRRRNEDVYLHCLSCCQHCALRPNFLKCLIMSSQLKRRKQLKATRPYLCRGDVERQEIPDKVKIEEAVWRREVYKKYKLQHFILTSETSLMRST